VGTGGIGACSLAGAFAVDALGPTEGRRFAGHLRGCARCRAELDQLRAAAAALGASSDAPAPPGLRARVLAGARRTVQDAPPAGAGTPQVLVSRRSSARPPALRRAAAACGAAAAVALAVVVALAALPGAPERVPELAARPAQVAALLAHDDASAVTLHGPAGWRAALVVAGVPGAALVADGVPALRDDQSYELWLLGPGEGSPPRPLGVFRPDRHGRVQVLTAGLPPDAVGYAVGVTVEPRSGSLRPSGEPVVSAGL
jgi:anti-sigma-K factor RskA